MQITNKHKFRRLMIATIGGSLVWHVLAIFLFSTVFTVEMGTDSIVSRLPQIKVMHFGSGSSLGLMGSVKETLTALEITLPEKRKDDKIAGTFEVPDEEVSIEEFYTPEIEDKGDPSSSSLSGLKEGKGTGTTGTGAPKVHRLSVGELTLSGPGSGRKIVYQPPEPNYPRQCEENGIEGDVSIEFVVNPNGNVTSVRIAKLSGSVLLDQTAKEYLQKFQFERTSYETKGELSVRFRLRKAK